MRRKDGRIWMDQLPSFLGMSRKQVERLIDISWFPIPNGVTPKSAWWWTSRVSDWRTENMLLIDAVVHHNINLGEGVNVPPSLFAGVKIMAYEVCRISPLNWVEFVADVRGNDLFPPPNSEGGKDGDPKKWWWDGEGLISGLSKLGPNPFEEKLGRKYVEGWHREKLKVALSGLGISYDRYDQLMSRYWGS